MTDYRESAIVSRQIDQAVRDAETARRCTRTEHVWPPEYEYGDTCNCGALYLLQDDVGFIRVQFTEPAE